MAKKKTADKKSYWMPINLWNLNEVFTTESISPISFYDERDFGNPVNRNQENIEDTNNLILFDEAVQADILLEILPELLVDSSLSQIKTDKKIRPASFEYSKTIYLKRGSFKVHFSRKEKMDEFLNNTFMLLEVKTVNKYKSDFVVDEIIGKPAYYQSKMLSDKKELQPFFDKAFNQIKGLIYGYLIGLLGTLGEKEQCLVSKLSELRNRVGSSHTDIVLSEQYQTDWLYRVREQIRDCSKIYVEIFGKNSDVFDILILRLEEIDNLNKMRCSDLEEQRSPSYKHEYEKVQKEIENTKRELSIYECEHEITFFKEELEAIKKEEETKGNAKGKTREYYKKGSDKYNRKQELKQLIDELKNNPEYKELKQKADCQTEQLRNFIFGFTQYDTSISEQFSRISEYLYEIIKKTTNFFLSQNNRENNFPDISFEIDIQNLSCHYFSHKKEYSNFVIKFPPIFPDNFNKTDLNLLVVALNSILAQPQGKSGNYSEQNILDILTCIGKKLPADSQERDVLRNYYSYRTGKTDTLTKFPENAVLANLIVFFMKLQGHEQINKMLVAKNIAHKQIAFMFYGAYVGFADMPKTFTNIIFDSNNPKLQDYIDDYLFSNYYNN
ncbi:MAG: hypothetical protein LBG80_19930 [Bacteroidales bacterium]|jgi:hypothetical protein|nr:hypothetical protein [Bacteroidales bacterium]